LLDHVVSGLNVNFVDIFESVVGVVDGLVDGSWSNDDWSLLDWGDWGVLGGFLKVSDLLDAGSVGFDVVVVESNEGSEEDGGNDSAMSMVSSSVASVVSVMSFTVVVSVMSVFTVVLWSLLLNLGNLNFFSIFLSIFFIIIVFVIFFVFLIIIGLLVFLSNNFFWELFGVVKLECDDSG